MSNMENRNTRLIFKGNRRRDGKYSVRIIYRGSPNMFGGYYPDKVYNKVMTTDKLQDYLGKPWIDVIDCPPELTVSKIKEEN